MINLSFGKTFLRGSSLLAPVFVASFLVSGSAWAQEPLQLRTDVSGTRDFRYELGIVAGGQFFNNEHTLSRADSDPPELSPASAGAFGLQFAVNLHRYISVEAEGLATRTNTRDFVSDMWIFQLGGQVRLHTTNLAGRLQPYLLLGYGAIASLMEDRMVLPDDQDGMARAGLGLRIALTERVGLRLEGRVQSSMAFASEVFSVGDETAYGGPDFLGLASLSFNVGATRPRLFVADKVVLKDPEIPDDDRDGLINRADKCPKDAEDPDGYLDDDGCPDEDNDKDGIADAKDRCPLRAEIKNSIEDDDGCPETDDDNDSILGLQDQCADKPETLNGFKDADGCPDELPDDIKRFTGVIDGIKFRARSENLVVNSYALLDRMVDVLNQYPDVKIEIGGHTDNRGKEAANKELSRKQAEKVREYLLSKGVKAERLVAVGYGIDRPLASNRSESGRAKNRRIELRVVRN